MIDGLTDQVFKFKSTGDSKIRLDKFLTEKVAGHSRAYLQKLIHEGMVTD